MKAVETKKVTSAIEENIFMARVCE